MENRKSVRLLVVHDHENYYDELCRVAEMNEHLYRLQCKFTSSGTEAVTLLDRWSPTIVLLDAHISDMNCFELLATCRERVVPVILTSRHNSLEIERSALKNGATGYCQDTIDPEAIDFVLEQIVLMAEEPQASH